MCYQHDYETPGFGYRAKYIVESAKMMQERGGEAWAVDMRTKTRDAARDQLITLSGVGPKVGDKKRCPWFLIAASTK